MYRISFGPSVEINLNPSPCAAFYRVERVWGGRRLTPPPTIRPLMELELRGKKRACCAQREKADGTQFNTRAEGGWGHSLPQTYFFPDISRRRRFWHTCLEFNNTYYVQILN